MAETPAWIRESYRRHAGQIFRRARRLLGSEADAHEVVQDVFLSLLEHPEQYAGRSNLTTFLYSVTTHNCLNRIRNHKNRVRLLQREPAPAEATAELGLLLSPERRLELHRMLARLPEEQARAAVYHHMDDLSHEDIAKLMGCSRRHVGNLLARVAAWAQEEGRDAR